MAGFLQARQRVGGYEIDELVGKGGMGEVYRARQLSMDRVVALKVLAARLAKQDTTFAKRFVDEARAAGRLNHPNIIAVHDVGKAMIPAPGGGEEEAYYFSMEFVDGETIKQIISREGPCRLPLVERMMGAMADALVYAESMGVVHRDIKPDNIMVTSDGLVKLADLGLAQQMGDESVGEKDAQGRSRVMGTPMYMSPEQARGLPTDHRSDQYSLGATLFHMLTGRAPYLGDSSKSIMRMHVFDPVPDPRDHAEVPEAWRKLCMRLLAKDPAQRYDSAEKLRAAVRAAIDGGQAGAAGVSRRIRPSGKPVKYETRPTTERVEAAAFVPTWAKAAIAIAIVVAIAIAIVIVSRIDGRNEAPPLVAPSQQPTGDDALARARTAIGSLPGDDEQAIEKLDALIGAATNAAAREALEHARDERAKRVDERKAARDGQQARLAQAQQAIADGRLGAARDALAALAAEKPSFVADAVAAAQAKLDAAVQAKVEALSEAASGATADGDLAAIQAQLDASGLAGDPAAAVGAAIAKRRADFAKAAAPATPTKPKVDAKALWREAYGEVAKLRGAVPARYDQFPALAQRLAAKAEADPSVADQLKRLGDLGDLLDKADFYLRNQLRSAKPRLNIKVGDHAQNLKVEDIDGENVYITTSSGRQPRSRTTALGLEDELRANASSLPADKRAESRRFVAAFIWYWVPDKAAAELATLPPDDPLAKALLALEQSGRVLEVAAPVQRQGDGGLTVTYDFTKKDPALLTDFAGEGASYGEHGLLWRSAKAASAPTEADLPTLRWKGRLQPPMTVTAKLLAGGDGECALIGALSGDRGVRVGIQHPQTFTIDVDPVLGVDGKLGIDHDNVARLNMLTPLTIGIEIQAGRKAVLSANGKPLGRGEAVPVQGEGPLTVALQAFQSQGKQVTLELLSLTISGRPGD